MNELEALGYRGVALIFSQEHTITIGTSTTLKCFTPEFIEYIHAEVTIGKYNTETC